MTPAIEDRAIEVQMLLADRGLHRAASIADVMIAAIAERVGLTVLHVDKDYELIAAVTGQPLERLRLASTGVSKRSTGSAGRTNVGSGG